jgi:hypothetical protein
MSYKHFVTVQFSKDWPSKYFVGSFESEESVPTVKEYNEWAMDNLPAQTNWVIVNTLTLKI